jgi:shikimate kinase
MKITLIGMASAGKSYWSARLAQAGFVHIDLDALIGQRLEAKTQQSFATTALMNEWLGFPDSAGFAERETLFVQTEAEIFKETLDFLENAPENANIVLDTGGSLVYSPLEYWQKLSQLSRIIYLKADKTLANQFAQAYLDEGRSILWRGLYAPLPNESRTESFLRCYKNLLEFRTAEYEKHAQYALEYAQHRSAEMSVATLYDLAMN